MTASSIRPVGFTGKLQELVWDQGDNVSVTAYLWGGGGGGGANGWTGGQGTRPPYQSLYGGDGGGGGFSTKTFTVNNGDVIGLAIGGGGNRGTNTATDQIIWSTLNMLILPDIVRNTNGNYCTFLNTYGVWNANVYSGNFSREEQVYFPVDGYYQFTASCDNVGDVYLDGGYVMYVGGFYTTYSSTTFVTAGYHSVVMVGVNTGGPASFGMTISPASTGYTWGGTGGASYIGDELWNLKTAIPADPPPPGFGVPTPLAPVPYNRQFCSFLNENGVWIRGQETNGYAWWNSYYITFPVSGLYTFNFSGNTSFGVQLWYDANHAYNLNITPSSAYRSNTRVVQNTVFIDAGTYIMTAQGIYNDAPAPGAAITINYGNGYNGGTGAAGREGGVTGNYGGGGGGGGGATVLFLNGTVIAGAGGGGGGGGGLSGAAYVTGPGGQSAPGGAGQSGSSTTGQDGQYGGTPGCGGGGGGVTEGGNGGDFNYTISDFAGQAGAGVYGSSSGDVTSIPSRRTPGGADNTYYLPGVGRGGQGGISNFAAVGGGNNATAGGPGYAALVFGLSGINIHDGLIFQPVSKTWVKDEGVWKPVQTTWVNDNGTWKEGRGFTPPPFTNVSGNFGLASRAHAPFVPPPPGGGGYEAGPQ